MCVDVDSGASNWIERTEQVKSFHRTEPKYHLVSRYDDKCLNIQHSTTSLAAAAAAAAV